MSPSGTTAFIRWPSGIKEHEILQELSTLERYIVMVESELKMIPMSIPTDWVVENDS